MIALIGAGGKMGRRIYPNLIKYGYDFTVCETNIQSRDFLRGAGLHVLETEQAVKSADTVIFAIPDAAMPALSAKYVPMLKRGATVIILDPAAAYAEKLTLRDDCTFVVTHPCHPPLFGERNTPEEKADLFGGTAAAQDIVIALLSGGEDKFLWAEELCKHIFAPVVNAHRITVEHMAILEPAAAEVVIAMCATVMKEAIDEAVNQGVPRAAAEAFLMGHIQIPLAIVLKSSNPFSDAAKIAVEYGKRRILKENWKDVFKRENIREVLSEMLLLDKPL
jgi:pyrroline-5-carboxylate reductase